METHDQDRENPPTASASASSPKVQDASEDPAEPPLYRKRCERFWCCVAAYPLTVLAVSLESLLTLFLVILVSVVRTPTPCVNRDFVGVAVGVASVSGTVAVVRTVKFDRRIDAQWSKRFAGCVDNFAMATNRIAGVFLLVFAEVVAFTKECPNDLKGFAWFCFAWVIFNVWCWMCDHLMPDEEKPKAETARVEPATV